MSLKTLAVATVIASASNAAGATTRGTLDCRELDGGIVTLKITNGGSGPTAACQGRILIAHDTGTTPTAASAGAVWKTIYVTAGDTVNSAVREFSYDFGPEVAHLEIEFAGNTGQAVTVEALATTFSYD